MYVDYVLDCLFFFLRTIYAQCTYENVSQTSSSPAKLISSSCRFPKCSQTRRDIKPSSVDVEEDPKGPFMLSVRPFQTMLPSLLTYFHESFTLAWMLTNTSTRGQRRVTQYIHQGAAQSQYIHQGAAQSQKFMTTTNSKTNMATVEEILIMFLLHKRQKRNPWFPVVLLRLVRIRKLYGNVQKYGRNGRRARTEGSVRIHIRM